LTVNLPSASGFQRGQFSDASAPSTEKKKKRNVVEITWQLCLWLTPWLHLLQICWYLQ